LKETLRNLCEGTLFGLFGGKHHWARQTDPTGSLRIAQKHLHRARTRKMFPLTLKTKNQMKKMFPFAAGTFVRSLLATMALTLVAGLTTHIAGAQTPSSSSAPQTAPAMAAPGTVAISKANAAALAVYTGPKYDNRWEVYGGLNLMNGQAGQNLQHRYNMGGVEVMGTYWLAPSMSSTWLKHVGVAADYHFGAGTTPVLSPYYNRVVVMQSIIAGGLEYRGPKNRYAALDLHAFGGGSTGIFDYAVNHFPKSTLYPNGSPVSSCPTNTQPGQSGNLGLYCNHTAPWGMAGASIDFNESAKIAIRLQPDITFEQFGTETREFFSISLGALYRFGTKK
jgi:hypothetical protein